MGSLLDSLHRATSLKLHHFGHIKISAEGVCDPRRPRDGFGRTVQGHRPALRPSQPFRQCQRLPNAEGASGAGKSWYDTGRKKR